MSVAFSANGHDIAFKMLCDKTTLVGQTLEHVMAKTGNMAEPEVVYAMCRFVKPGDTVIDAGANAGFFSLLLSRLSGPSGHVMAFEPISATFKRLMTNVLRNQVTNIHLFPMALCDVNVMMRMSLMHDDGMCSFINYGESIGYETVMARRLDSMGLPLPRLLKIDCEGAELMVLKGADYLLQDGIDAVIVEINRHTLAAMGISDREIRDYMHALGYECFVLNINDALPFHIPHGVNLTHDGKFNVLFSTVDKVGAAWPEVRIAIETH